MRHRLAALLFAALVLVLAAFTGTSLAGNGHGNGGGSDHGQQSSKQSDTTATSPATGGDNSQGVKPDSTTQHDTYASASSNKTKQYGNGTTAGQVATKAGFGSATLHGPGNSQPHKTACGSHEVDVHALKHQSSKCASTQSSSTQTSSTQSAGVSASAQQHVTICHATGSATNPFVMISPSASGVFHGHMGHQGGRDIIPPFVWNGATLSQNWDANGQAIFNAGCTVAQSSSTQSTQSIESTESTQTQSSTSVTAGTAAAATTLSSTQATTQSSTAPATSTPASTGAVKGATVALKAKSKAKPAGGVLGTTTRLGGTVGSSRLPFTGLSLWIYALVAAGLVGLGLVARRAADNRL